METLNYHQSDGILRNGKRRREDHLLALRGDQPGVIEAETSPINILF